MTTQQKVGIQFEGKQPFKITVSKDAHIDDLKVKAIEDSKQSTIFPSDVEVKKEDTILNPSNSVISEMDDGWGRNAKNPFVLHIITEDSVPVFKSIQPANQSNNVGSLLTGSSRYLYWIYLPPLSSEPAVRYIMESKQNNSIQDHDVSVCVAMCVGHARSLTFLYDELNHNSNASAWTIINNVTKKLIGTDLQPLPSSDLVVCMAASLTSTTVNVMDKAATQTYGHWLQCGGIVNGAETLDNANLLVIPCISPLILCWLSSHHIWNKSTPFDKEAQTLCTFMKQLFAAMLQPLESRSWEYFVARFMMCCFWGNIYMSTKLLPIEKKAVTHVSLSTFFGKFTIKSNCELNYSFQKVWKLNLLNIT